MEYLVEMEGISKRFGIVQALDNVDFYVREGEIHALLGENAAGKTTLMNILYGRYKPDSGIVRIEGREVNFKSPKDAIKAGIYMVPQFPQLVSTLTGLENLAPLGRERIRFKKIKQMALEICEDYGFNLDLDKPVWTYGLAQRRMLNVVQAKIVDKLYGIKVLIYDEPLTFLSPKEKKKIVDSMERMREEGKSVIFITHNIPKALEIADRTTVLRKGKVVGVYEKEDFEKERIYRDMFGGYVPKQRKRKREVKDKIIFEVRNLTVRDDYGEIRVKDVSFAVREGEIYGILGLPGMGGQRILVEALIGLRKAKGKIVANGEDITKYSTRKRRKYIGFIPEDRMKYGIFGGSLFENLYLGEFLEGGFFIDWDEVKRKCERLVSEYEIATPNLDFPAVCLSGGNIQRLILAREVGRRLILIAYSPKVGLDARTCDFIDRKLEEQARKGCVVLISYDIEEVLGICDRIAALYEGKLVKEFDAREIKMEDLEKALVGEI